MGHVPVRPNSLGIFPKSSKTWRLGDENPEIHDARTASDGKIVDGIGFYGV